MANNRKGVRETSASQLADYIQDRNNRRGFQQERLLIEVASLIHQTMKKKGITRKSLAESLGVTKGRISQYLGGERNLTLRTLADIFTAMDSMAVVRAADLSIETIITPDTTPKRKRTHREEAGKGNEK